MKNNSKIAALCEGAMMTALSVLFLLIIRFVPVFWVPAVVAACIPTTVLSLRRNLSVSVISVIAATVVFFIVTGAPVSGLISSAFYLLPGIAIGYTIKKGYKFYTVLLATCGTIVLGMVIDFAIINFVAAGNGVSQMIEEAVSLYKTALNDALAQALPSGSAEADEIKKILNNLFEQFPVLIRWYLPSLVVIVSLVISYATLVFNIFILKRLKMFSGEYLPFCMIKVPRSMCYVALIIVLCINFFDSNIIKAVLDNMSTVMYFVIGVSGFACIDFLLKKKIKAGGVRILIYLAVFFMGYIFIGIIMYAFVILGLIDGIRNFRKI